MHQPMGHRKYSTSIVVDINYLVRLSQSRSEQSRAEKSGVEQSRAEQSRAEQSRAEQSRDISDIRALTVHLRVSSPAAKPR